MDNSIGALIKQVESLIDSVKLFRGCLEHHVIIEPKNRLDEALCNGFPEDIYAHYLYNYLKSDKEAAEIILNYIDCRFVPYLQNVSFHLQEALKEGSGGVATSTTLSNPTVPIPKKLEIREKKLVDDVEMKKGCIICVSRFFKERKDQDFAEKGEKERCEIAHQFYDEIKREMGINAKLSFDPTMESRKLGGYNFEENTIKLNAKYLESRDCKELMETILHESRHAYQKRCVVYPELTTVSEKTQAVWKENFDHYISSEYDFVAYENQEIEKDANYFASTTMRDGSNRQF